MTEAPSHVASPREIEANDAETEKGMKNSQKAWMGLTGLFFLLTVVFLGLYAAKDGSPEPAAAPSTGVGAGAPEMAKSVSTYLVKLTTSQKRYCKNNPNANNAACADFRRYKALKTDMGDHVCTMLGKLHSLVSGMQMNIADTSSSCYNGKCGAELSDAIENGDRGFDVSSIDKHWANIVGNQANFNVAGHNQWAIGYFITRQKMLMKTYWPKLLNTIDDWMTQSGRRRVEDLRDMLETPRRRAGYQGNGYPDNLSGTSSVLNLMASYPDISQECDNFLSNLGSGLENAGEACSDACSNSLDKKCSFCGTGKCCKNGQAGTGNGRCSGNVGGADRHVCVTSGSQANTRFKIIKKKIGDSVCTLLGKMHSLVMGLQMVIAEGEDACYNSACGGDLIEKIQDGDWDAETIDKAWAQIVGNMENFGDHQWQLAYLFVREKLIMKDTLGDIFDTLDDWKAEHVPAPSSARRRPGYQGDGYPDNRSGASSVLSKLSTQGPFMGNCQNWLATEGSGLEMPGEACSDACSNSLSELCSFCGTGKCCKSGTSGGSTGCDGNEGGADRYVCVASD